MSFKEISSSLLEPENLLGLLIVIINSSSFTNCLYYSRLILLCHLSIFLDMWFIFFLYSLNYLDSNEFLLSSVILINAKNWINFTFLLSCYSNSKLFTWSTKLIGIEVSIILVIHGCFKASLEVYLWCDTIAHKRENRCDAIYEKDLSCYTFFIFRNFSLKVS